MKLKKFFIIRDVMGETLIVAVGREAKNFPGVIQCNETAGQVAKLLKNDTTESAIVEAMIAIYDGDPEKIAADVAKTLSVFRRAGILEE